MKRRTHRPGRVLDQFFARASKPTREQVDISREKVLLRLTGAASEENREDDNDESTESVQRVRWPFQLWAARVAVATVILAIAGLTVIFRNPAAPAGPPPIAEAVTGTIYRISDRESSPVPAGGAIATGAVIRSDGGNGAVIALDDGSRIEMRSRSEVALDRADDGVRIRLTTGSLIVNAAKQRTGHLYVQTRDVTVSVIGTVFLVESEETGSRVAVLQGEVHVQQGATVKKLLPGDQVTTAPSIKPAPVAEEISWSRNVEAHLALLQQALLLTSAISPQNRQPRQTFDEVSITARGPAGRVPNVLGPLGAGECGGRVQLDSKRFAITNTSLYNLIALAYGIDCRNARLGDLISAGPSWIKSDRFDIEATIPEGLPGYTPQQLNNREAPALQALIQTLLADRFRLVVHRETRETAVYNLVVVRDGGLKPSEDLPTADLRQQASKLGNEFVERGMLLAGGSLGMIIDESGLATIRGLGISIPATFTLLYTQIKDRPILDKTNLKGRFEFQLQFAAAERVPGLQPATRLPAVPDGPSLFDALQDQLGLKLDPVRIPMEVLMIDRAEKPPQN